MNSSQIGGALTVSLNQYYAIDGHRILSVTVTEFRDPGMRAIEFSYQLGIALREFCRTQALHEALAEP